MARDRPVYRWVFDWAADLITRYAHVGDLGKTAIQWLRLQVKQKHCAIWREDLVHVNTTPQMTCFRGAKVCTNWQQGQVMMNCYSRTLS